MKDRVFTAALVAAAVALSAEAGNPSAVRSAWVRAVLALGIAVDAAFVAGYILVDVSVDTPSWPSFYTHPWRCRSSREEAFIDGEEELTLVGRVGAGV